MPCPTCCKQSGFKVVRNGSTADSPLLGKFCGSTLPSPVFPQSNQLYLRFKSDYSLAMDGFEATWTSSPQGCGGTLYGDHGSFASPNYPGTYPNGTHCEWAVNAPRGRVVTVTFNQISIDDEGSCERNYLKLYNGPDASSALVGAYCGTQTNLNKATSDDVNPAHASVLIQRSAPGSEKCSRIREVLQDQRSAPGSEKCSRVREVLQGQRSAPGSEKCSRVREVLQDQRSAPGSEKCSRVREVLQGQRSAPGSDNWSRVREVLQDQRSAPGSENWSRVREVLQGQRSAPGSENCSRETDIAPYTSSSHQLYFVFSAQSAALPSGFRLIWTS
ncbi:hypothetical protein WMY93_029780 [Mugilogobius chulae]|uniref:CUB domain-containing protein n=1 Tax=Mugilogobius chulae TaxID=88201 RepID=A0AAW0MQA6_9GOBI